MKKKIKEDVASISAPAVSAASTALDQKTTSDDIKFTPGTLGKKKKTNEASASKIDMLRMWEIARFFVKAMYAREKSKLVSTDWALKRQPEYDIEVYIREGKSPTEQLESIRDFVNGAFTRYLISKGFVRKRDTWETVKGLKFYYRNYVNYNTGIQVTITNPFLYRSDSRWRVKVKISTDVKEF